MVTVMTREEFEISYAVNAGLLVPQLKLLGLEAVPCDCGEPDCQGWQMISVAEALRSQRTLFVDENGVPFEDRIKC